MTRRRGSRGRVLPPLVTVVAFVAVVASACTTSERATAGSATERVELTVFGAASLRGVLSRIESAYERGHPDIDITVSTDSSAALRTQIEQGAPADVFLSADTKSPQALAAAGLSVGSPIPFAGNRLAIVVPPGNPAGVSGPADLARPGLKIIAAGDQVPITGYATEAIESMGALPGYPAGFADAYAANVVSHEDNVGAIVAKIELREGDAAIVYATDARASELVGTIPIPDAADPTAAYAGVVTAASSRRQEAAAFFDWLVGPAGQAILAEAGFLPPT